MNFSLSFFSSALWAACMLLLMGVVIACLYLAIVFSPITGSMFGPNPSLAPQGSWLMAAGFLMVAFVPYCGAKICYVMFDISARKKSS